MLRPSNVGRTLAVLALLAGAHAAASGEALRSRSFRLAYQITVDRIPVGAKSLEVWLPHPRTDENQTIERVTIRAPGPVSVGRSPEHGNEFLYFHAERPRGAMELRMEVQATRRENAGHAAILTAAERRAYLRGEPLVPVDGRIKALALEATRGRTTDAEKARGIYEHVTSLVKYDKSGVGWGRGDALFACDAATVRTSTP